MARRSPQTYKKATTYRCSRLIFELIKSKRVEIGPSVYMPPMYVEATANVRRCNSDSREQDSSLQGSSYFFASGQRLVAK
jgi:hypothetical protein